jgi:hypothetical protein
MSILNKLLDGNNQIQADLQRKDKEKAQTNEELFNLKTVVSDLRERIKSFESNYNGNSNILMLLMVIK